MINYFHELLLYTVNSPALIILLILLLGLSCCFTLKIKLISKKKKKPTSNTSTNGNTTSTGFVTPPKAKYHNVQKHNVAPSRVSNSSFFAESVSQVFESKAQKRSR